MNKAPRQRSVNCWRWWSSKLAWVRSLNAQAASSLECQAMKKAYLIATFYNLSLLAECWIAGGKLTSGSHCRTIVTPSLRQRT